MYRLTHRRDLAVSINATVIQIQHTCTDTRLVTAEVGQGHKTRKQEVDSVHVSAFTESMMSEYVTEQLL